MKQLVRAIVLLVLPVVILSACAAPTEQAQSQTPTPAPAATQAPTATEAVLPTATLAPTATFTAAPTETPTREPTPARTRLPGELLFDDFSASGLNWSTTTDEFGTVNVSDGALHFILNDDDVYYLSTPGSNDLGDVAIEVDITRVSGPEENQMGVFCRYQDPQNYYAFNIGSRGYFSVYKVVGGQREIIRWSEGVKPEVVPSVDSVIHVRAVCSGQDLEFYVNGTRLAKTYDPTFPSGNVGLMAVSWGVDTLDVAFDNFLVVEPPEGE